MKLGVRFILVTLLLQLPLTEAVSIQLFNTLLHKNLAKKQLMLIAGSG